MSPDAPIVWRPSEELRARSSLTRYLDWLAERGRGFAAYDDLWRWSVDDLDGFWGSLWTYFGVPASAPPSTILAAREMPGARWFEGAQLNYAAAALAGADDRPAVVALDEAGGATRLTRAELLAAVGATAVGLRELGVRRGDRVAAYLPNGVEAVVALLATASIGAIWSACAPDFGPAAVIDRFRQIRPSVLIAVDAYRFGGRVFDRRNELADIVGALPDTTCVLVPGPGSARFEGAALSWDDLVSTPAAPTFEQLAFDEPLWILYSSGTTGLPKAMVQSHGGILLEHLKSLSLHLDLGLEDRFFWFTTTGWMMWNFLVSGLLVGSTIVLYDGSPSHPDLLSLWRLAASEGVTYFGTSAPFLHACQRRALDPRATVDLSSLAAIGSTGSPLSPEGFAWVAERVDPSIWLGSISGGTDVCTAVVGSCPLLPVRLGEIQCRWLGAKVEAFDPSGRSVIDEVGELVITAPMPSMPVGFWNDPDAERYRASYFDAYPGVWRHGDWLRITPSGGCVISGRSDATLNRGGIRVGTSEFYRIVEAVPGIAESLVVDTGELGADGELIVFVAMEPTVPFDDGVRTAIAEALRSQLSPRHVPDRVVAAPGVPCTLNGKRLEVPVKRLLMGAAPGEVANADALRDPAVFEWYVRYARGAGD
ncbi:MAG TPA: acetoacetate--CoA ligase [Actinomycetota bacterium]|jgi:acetoacetyl-CoA synthetase